MKVRKPGLAAIFAASSLAVMCTLGADSGIVAQKSATPAPSQTTTPVVPGMPVFNPDKRIIYLKGKIDDALAVQIISQLAILEEKAPGKPIEMHIQSGGGEVEAGFKIVDMMDHITSPVKTVAEGDVSSMAAFILINGTIRSAAPHAVIMIHELADQIGRRKFSELTSDINSDVIYEDYIVDLLAGHSHYSRKQIEDIIRGRNVYMTPQQALEQGFLTMIEESVHKPPHPLPPRTLPTPQVLTAP